MPTYPDNGAIVKSDRWKYWLAFNLYFGAALSDANDAQRTQFKLRMFSYFEMLKSDGSMARVILGEIRRIMGNAWEPSEVWSAAIRRVLNEEVESHHGSNTTNSGECAQLIGHRGPEGAGTAQPQHGRPATGSAPNQPARRAGRYGRYEGGRQHSDERR